MIILSPDNSNERKQKSNVMPLGQTSLLLYTVHDRGCKSMKNSTNLKIYIFLDGKVKPKVLFIKCTL